MELTTVHFQHPRALLGFFTVWLPTQGPHSQQDLDHGAIPTSLVHQPVPALQFNQQNSFFTNAGTGIISLPLPCLPPVHPILLSCHPQDTAKNNIFCGEGTWH